MGASVRAAGLEAYGRLPLIEDIALSPDGKSIALIETDGEQRTILIKEADTGASLGGLRAGNKKVRWLNWAGSDHLIVTTTVTSGIPFTTAAKSEWAVGLDYNIRTHSQRALLNGVKDGLNVQYGQPAVRILHGHPFVFIDGDVLVDNRGRLALLKVDLDHGDEVTVVDSSHPFTNQYTVSEAGEPAAEAEYDAGTTRWTLRIFKNGFWRSVDQEKLALDTPSLEGLGRDGQSIVTAFHRDSGDILRDLSPGDRTWSAERPAPDRLIHDPATHRLIGEMSLDHDLDQVTFYDPRDQAGWRAVTTAYGKSRVTLASLSDDHNRLIVNVDSPTEGPAYALIDLATHHAQWIGLAYPDLKPADIGAKQALAFKAADGTDLTGYLTLPPGGKAKALPLVVLPHGGPGDRDEPGFDWWAQALASRGYAVLQVNYRGSSGFGWAFQSAGFGQWGRKMQTDLSDGVRYLATQGVIDPKRACIVGASYGGYAALAGATLDPGVYRCAVSVAGPSDLKRLISWSSERQGEQGLETERFWLRYMGRRETLDSISPVKLADRVTIPILLIHGQDDTVVPYDQSQIMFDTLRKAGKDVRLVTLKKEDHWLSRGETRLQMLQATLAFLEKNNPAT
jgi:dipeptidyl aminopeptidase/acylaminoacyl peptidase